MAVNAQSAKISFFVEEEKNKKEESDENRNDESKIDESWNNENGDNENWDNGKRSKKKSYVFGEFFNTGAVFNLIKFLNERRKEEGEIRVAGKALELLLGSVMFPKETSLMYQTFPSLFQQTLLNCTLSIFNTFSTCF